MIALASSQPELYNRSKWTGCDLAVDNLGIIESVHRLLSTTYVRFCASYLAGSAAIALLEEAKFMRHYYLQTSDSVAIMDGVVELGTDENTDPLLDVDSDNQPRGDKVDSVEWVKVNALHRQLGMDFVRLNPLGQLVLMRLLMEPLRIYLSQQFDRASAQFDFTERASMVGCINSGRQPCRKLRIVEVAAGADDENFMARVKVLFTSSELWSVMPPAHTTVQMRSLAFRTLSRLGCSFSQYLMDGHSKFPFQLFRILTHPALAAEFANVKECLLDRWTKDFRKQFPGLSGEECTQILYTIALLVPVDITVIESLNATLRRILTHASVNTWQQSFTDLAARFRCNQYCTWQRRQSFQAHSRPPRTTGTGSRGKKLTRRSRRKPDGTLKPLRPGKGGPWRAWMRKKARHCKPGDRVTIHGSLFCLCGVLKYAVYIFESVRIIIYRLVIYRYFIDYLWIIYGLIIYR